MIHNQGDCFKRFGRSGCLSCMTDSRKPPALLPVTKTFLCEFFVQFIAHAHAQEHLLEMWYSEMTWLQHMGFWRVPLIVLGGICLPFLVLVYVLSPYSKPSLYMRIPVIKFSFFAYSYIVFLLCLLFASISQSFRSPIDMPVDNFIINTYIMAYVIGESWNFRFYLKERCFCLWQRHAAARYDMEWNQAVLEWRTRKLFLRHLEHNGHFHDHFVFSFLQHSFDDHARPPECADEDCGRQAQSTWVDLKDLCLQGSSLMILSCLI